MSTLDANQVLNRARTAVKASTDSQLADYFGKPRSTISGWRQRGTVPIEELVTLARDKRVSLDWLLTGAEAGVAAAEESSPEKIVAAYQARQRAVSTAAQLMGETLTAAELEAVAGFVYKHRLSIEGVEELVSLLIEWGEGRNAVRA